MSTRLVVAMCFSVAVAVAAAGLSAAVQEQPAQGPAIEKPPAQRPSGQKPAGASEQAEPQRAAAEPLRLLGFRAKSADQARLWQQRARITLAVLLQIDDLIAANCHDEAGRSRMPLKAKELACEQFERFSRYELSIQSRPDRCIKLVLTVPAGAKPGKTPAVICIHGHGGNRNIVYKPESAYRGFALRLAESGYVTLSTEVGQHKVQDQRRTLMGERLWDLVRLVDFAVTRQEVDPERIGCAGLSLGGEMAMWLGAMDRRIAATVSSGFLTVMENLRHKHCQCWDFPGLQRRYEFSDIYSLIAPRPLQCQNGKKERLPGGFPVELAQKAMAEVQRAYAVLGHPEAVELAVHPGGHVFDVDAGLRFLEAHLKGSP